MSPGGQSGGTLPANVQPPCPGCIALGGGKGSDARRSALLAILAAAVRVTVELENGKTIRYEPCARHRRSTPQGVNT